MRQVILRLSLAVLSLGPLWGTLPGEQSSSQMTFHVSPQGSDSNPGTEQQPFRTIERARDAVRSNTEDMAQNIVVYLRGGTYNIDRTLVFDHRDSGKNGYTVVYRNYENESPIISGGQKIGGWRLDSGNRWRPNSCTRPPHRARPPGGRRGRPSKTFGSGPYPRFWVPLLLIGLASETRKTQLPLGTRIAATAFPC